MQSPHSVQFLARSMPAQNGPFSQKLLPHAFHHGADAQHRLDGDVFRAGLAVVAPAAEDLVVALLQLGDLAPSPPR